MINLLFFLSPRGWLRHLVIVASVVTNCPGLLAVSGWTFDPFTWYAIRSDFLIRPIVSSLGKVEIKLWLHLWWISGINRMVSFKCNEALTPVSTRICQRCNVLNLQQLMSAHGVVHLKVQRIKSTRRTKCSQWIRYNRRRKLGNDWTGPHVIFKRREIGLKLLTERLLVELAQITEDLLGAYLCAHFILFSYLVNFQSD